MYAGAEMSRCRVSLWWITAGPSTWTLLLAFVLKQIIYLLDKQAFLELIMIQWKDSNDSALRKKKKKNFGFVAVDKNNLAP